MRRPGSTVGSVTACRWSDALTLNRGPDGPTRHPGPANSAAGTRVSRRAFAVARVCGGAGLRWRGFAVARVCGGAGLRWRGFAVARVCGGAGLRWRGFAVARVFRKRAPRSTIAHGCGNPPPKPRARFPKTCAPVDDRARLWKPTPQAPRAISENMRTRRRSRTIVETHPRRPRAISENMRPRRRSRTIVETHPRRPRGGRSAAAQTPARSSEARGDECGGTTWIGGAGDGPSDDEQVGSGG